MSVDHTLRRALPLSVFAFMIGLIGSTTFGQDLGLLEGALRRNGYELYNPPRANWGPGFVFAGDVVNNRITNVEEICPTLYADVGPPQAVAVVLANYKTADSLSFGLAIDFLKGLLGGALDLDRVKREHTAEVIWQNIQELSYTHMDQWLDTGEPRPISKRCRTAIEDLKSKNRFTDRIFVIVRAVAPEILLYDFSHAIKAEGGSSAEITQALQAAAKGKGEVRNNTQLEIKERLFIGYAPPVKIEDWLPTGLVSGEIIKLRGTKTTFTIE